MREEIDLDAIAAVVFGFPSSSSSPFPGGRWMMKKTECHLLHQ